MTRVDRALQDRCLIRSEQGVRQRQDAVDAKLHRLSPGLHRRCFTGTGAEQLKEAVKSAGRSFHGVDDDIVHACRHASEAQ